MEDELGWRPFKTRTGSVQADEEGEGFAEEVYPRLTPRFRPRTDGPRTGDVLAEYLDGSEQLEWSP